MKKTLNWGIIGLGNAAFNFAECFKMVDNINLYAIASKSGKQTNLFNSIYKINKIYSSYTELINDPNVNIVYISTPNSFHYELIIDCINANKHILCEKPICISLNEIDSVIALARNKGIFIMEAMWTRFIPGIELLYRIVKSNLFGELHHIETKFCFMANTGRLLRQELGGGALLDVGVYSIFLSLFLIGNPALVFANSVKNASGVDLYTNILLSYNGKKSAYSHSSICEYENSRAEISFKKAIISIEEKFYAPDSFTIETKDGIRFIKCPYVGNGLKYQIDEVVKCISENLYESPKMTLEDSRNILRIIEKVRTFSYPFLHA